MKRPYKQQVIVRLILQDRDSILLFRKLKRKKTFYSLPGGRVESGESLRSALIRETLEEIGIRVRRKNLEFVHIVHRHDHRASIIHVFFRCKKWKGKPVNMEPDKCAGIFWNKFNKLPAEFIDPIGQALELYPSGISYSEFNWNGKSGSKPK